MGYEVHLSSSINTCVIVSTITSFPSIHLLTPSALTGLFPCCWLDRFGESWVMCIWYVKSFLMFNTLQIPEKSEEQTQFCSKRSTPCRKMKFVPVWRHPKKLPAQKCHYIVYAVQWVWLGLLAFFLKQDNMTACITFFTFLQDVAFGDINKQGIVASMFATSELYNFSCGAC